MIENVVNVLLLSTILSNNMCLFSNSIDNNQIVSTNSNNQIQLADVQNNETTYEEITNPRDARFTRTTIYTSKGTSISALYALNDFTASTKENFKNYFINIFPSVAFISEATTKYNCHSYAWYNRSSQNTVWLNDPSTYITDGIYVESTGNVGDILCYYDSSNTIIHSAVVTARTSPYVNSIDDLNNVQVTSKWGMSPLFSHKGSVQPYEETTSIKYYTCASHNVKVTYTSNDSSTHTVTCDNCTHSKIEGHSLYLDSTGYKKCRYCSYKTKYKFDF